MNPTVDFSQLPLRDIHLPGAVPWWPPAPGWWLLGALVLVGLVALALRYYGQRRRRAALRALAAVQAALARGAEPVARLQQVSMLLRRFAMTAAERSGRASTDVAGLIGEGWLAYLDSSWDRDAFRRGPGRLLLEGPYGRPDTVTREQVQLVTELCADWIRRQPTAPPNWVHAALSRRGNLAGISAERR